MKRKTGIQIAFYFIMKKLKDIRKEYILKVLSDTGWDIKKASKILNISETFLKKEIHKIAYSDSGIHKK